MLNSLRLRLVLLLSLGLGLAWAVAAWLSYSSARHEVDELFDAQLAQAAHALIGTSRHALRERAEHGDDDEHVPSFHAYERKQIFQVWDEDGLQFRSSSAPETPMAPLHKGYVTIMMQGVPWRVLTQSGSHRQILVQVAEPMAGREEMARHITLNMALPSLLVLPVLALVIWFGVGMGLGPLRRIKREVKQRQADWLEPVSTDDVPEEVLPLVNALNDLFARVRQAFEHERSFTADAAHELRTPLAALKAQAQVAKRAGNDDERNAALDNILLGVERATHLVAQLLTLARVDADTRQLQHAALNLRPLVVEVLAAEAVSADAKSIDLAIDDGPDCQVSGNAAQLAILVRNLVDNAIRYTPQGGKVHVSLGLVDNQAVLQVVDSGCGIPEDERARVLDRFYRIPGNEAVGSGLGLSIVARIAESHGAALTLQDGLGGAGLAVKIVFPSV